MERLKRQSDDTVYGQNKNKKAKLSVSITKCCFENLANELLYEIFEYLDINDIYNGFFHLNNRYENLLINLNIPFQLNLSLISKSEFDFYYENILLPNKHWIKILRLSNPFSVDQIFSPPRLICDFNQIEKLIFDQIHSKYLHNILKHCIHLSKLHTLILSSIDYIENASTLFNLIFRLKQLKSCQLTYQIRDTQKLLPINFNPDEQSSIEYLTIHSPFPYESFQKFFHCLPKLRHLSMNYLFGSNSSRIDFYPIELKDCKSISFELYSIYFDQFKKLIENFFHHIEILRISTFDDSSYSHAEQWKDLILSSLPNLCRFDLNNNYSGIMDRFLYLCTGGQFRSKFWTNKKCFFHHQYGSGDKSNDGRFYSTNPYRRKDYTFYWQYDHDFDHQTRKFELKSVKHLHVCGRRAINNSLISFPNVNQLTIHDYARPYFGSILTALEQILSLKQLLKMTIECDQFPVDQMLNFLRLTPNLHTLKWNFQSIDRTKLKLIEQSATFQSLSETNQVQNLEILHCCSFEEIQFFVHLFPQLKSLRIEVWRKEIVQMTRYILLNMDHLFFLHIKHLPKTYLQKLNLLIQSEHLLDDFLIQFIDRDIYLWW